MRANKRANKQAQNRLCAMIRRGAIRSQLKW